MLRILLSDMLKNHDRKDVVEELARGAISDDIKDKESSAKEFAPLTVSLTNDGFRTLRQSLISHFDVVMVPASRQWALVMSHELEGMLFGPESFLAAIDAHPVNAQHVAD